MFVIRSHTHIIICSTNSRYRRQTSSLLAFGLEPVAMFNNIAVCGKTRHKNQLINTATTAITATNNNNNKHNKPDIIRDNERATCMLIDVAISGDRTVIKKEAEKILKYKDLTIEVQRMWNVKTKVIPVIIGATGTI